MVIFCPSKMEVTRQNNGHHGSQLRPWPERSILSGSKIHTKHWFWTILISLFPHKQVFLNNFDKFVLHVLPSSILLKVSKNIQFFQIFVSDTLNDDISKVHCTLPKSALFTCFFEHASHPPLNTSSPQGVTFSICLFIIFPVPVWAHCGMVTMVLKQCKCQHRKINHWIWDKNGEYILKCDHQHQNPLIPCLELQLI